VIFLQKWHTLFHTCPSVLTCRLLWQPSCTDFVIPTVLVVDGICRLTADVKLLGYINDGNSSVLLNQSINSLKIICHLQSG